MKKRIFIIVMLLMLFLLTACKEKVPSVETMSFEKDVVNMYVGETFEFIIKTNPVNSYSQMYWNFDNSYLEAEYIEFGTTNRIKAIQLGETQIKVVTRNNVECVCTVNITEPNRSEYSDVIYEQVARVPDDYIGRMIKVRGTVVQVLETENQVDIRLAVNDDYNQIVYVTYNPDIVDYRMLENDHVTVYGEFKGLYTYTSAMNVPITVPDIKARIIDQ